MQVEFGNPSPHQGPVDNREPVLGPAVTYLSIPDSYTMTDGADIDKIARGIATSANGVTNLPGHEALLCVVHQAGMWPHHGAEAPSWVWSDNAEFARQLGEWFGCPVGRPDDLEATHYTLAGVPGVGV